MNTRNIKLTNERSDAVTLTNDVKERIPLTPAHSLNVKNIRH